MSITMRDVFIYSMTFEAVDILRIELRLPDGGDLPAFTTGSHINLKLNDKLTRSYSLINDASERHRYLIAVHKDEHGRGGSRYLHETARVGQKMQCSEPVNAFPLNEDANMSVLIAGGIGITPIWSMIQRLEVLGKKWELHYRARSREKAALLTELEALGRTRNINISYSNETMRDMCDVRAIVANAPDDADLYCCGPLEMLEVFDEICAPLDVSRVHTERFQADGEIAVQGGFILKAVKSNMELEVKEGQTILQVLRDAGLDPAYSCESGLCGECQTRVISGEPDHQDLYLTEDEKESGESIMICCSGSLTPILEIDQ